VVAEALCSLLVCVFAAGVAAHQLHERGAPTCAATADAAAEQLQATLLHNRWNVFTGAEPYVVWEMAPAKLGDGRVVDLWRNTEQVSWEVPRGAAPAHRGGRWRSWPYLAERAPAEDAVFWGALCDEWEDRAAARGCVGGGCRVDSFAFYLMQADVVPFGHDAPADAPPAADDSALHPRAARLAAGYSTGVWAGYLPEYGVVRKRRIVTFSCLERKVLEVTR